jgi:hypothetical protein
MSCLICFDPKFVPDETPAQRRRTEKVNLAAARQDAKWFKSHKKAVACARLVGKGEIPGVTERS